MSASDAEVRKVARLARLAIREDRIHRLRHQLAAVLTCIDRLRRLDFECWAYGARRRGGGQA
jgi:Asp-tRNA(Asn)/Glu-tRNA(Gln) amidotransferase C subunit